MRFVNDSQYFFKASGDCKAADWNSRTANVSLAENASLLFISELTSFTVLSVRASQNLSAVDKLSIAYGSAYSFDENSF